jgi:hypothetical protein
VAYAQVALERWPGLPVFELYAHDEDRWGTQKDLLRLQEAYERAHKNGDARTAQRLRELLLKLHFTSQFEPQRITPLPNLVRELLKQFSVDELLEWLESGEDDVGFEMPPGFEQLHMMYRLSGSEVVRKYLENVKADLLESDEDDNRPPPRRRGKAKPRTPANAPQTAEDDAAPQPQQLDLFE